MPDLPPGPRAPALLQTIGWWSRPTAYASRCRARHGSRFTLRLLGQPPIVIISDPDEVRELFTAPADVVHPGEGTSAIRPIVGEHSVITLDEEPHLEQRRLMLPAFHGERMERLSSLIAELAEREIERWPRGEPLATHPRLQRLTLEIIMRAVFGSEPGERHERLREALIELLAFGESPLSLMPATRRSPLLRGRWARFERARAQSDAALYALIDERRARAEPGEDVLAMLLQTEMSPAAVRDELVTALVAGHETTASQLAWALVLLARAPDVQRAIQQESVDDEAPYLNATISEVLRLRPVLPTAEPRRVNRPITIGGRRYEPGVVLLASAHLVHHDPTLYPDPEAFRPERFLDAAPGTYTWIAFGGGRRRCLGVSFALLEMRIFLRTLLERCELAAAGDAPERVRRRGITSSPARGGEVRLADRVREPVAA
ncbi:MAG TPA: cytochrome P450 [Solirubrobacteraceae bacterium]|nr:cytochrome P450 [Solirubrobacteraceae bacterium]